MNKSYKVVFSKVRGALMVVNEATASVQAKGTKTVLAAAVALISGAALAGETLEPVSSLDGQTVGNAEWIFDSDNPMHAYVQPDEKGEAVIKDSSIKDVTVTLNDTSGNPSAVGLTARGTKVSPMSIKVTKSSFENIKLTATGKVAANNGPHGTAIATNWASLSLEASLFSNNALVSTNEQAQGGALYMSFGKIDAKNTEFRGNKAETKAASGEVGAFGGAAALFGVDGTIEGATFEGNQAIADSKNTSAYSLGGALYLRSKFWGGTAGDATTVSVKTSSFTNNKALRYDGEGGAVYVKGDDSKQFAMNLTSEGNVYQSNEASNLGGAIYALDTKLTSTGDTFTGNNAKNGGALYFDAALADAEAETLTITGARFENNVASRDGGAAAISDLYADNAQTIRISDSVFTGNTSARKGGAVVIYDMEGHQFANVTMKNVTFTNNQTAAGEDGDKANSNGGAIYSESDLTIQGNSSFEGNTAETNGGAIYLGQTTTATSQDNSASLTLSAGENESIHFADNKAGGKANDIYLSASTASTFEGKGRIELLSGLAGAGSVTSTAANVYVADVSGFTGTLTISGGVFEVNAEGYLNQKDKYVFGSNALVQTSGEGVLKLGGVTQAGDINITNNAETDALNVAFEDAFLTGTIVDGKLTIETDTSFIENSSLGQEVSDNVAALFARGATAREARIL